MERDKKKQKHTELTERKVTRREGKGRAKKGREWKMKECNEKVRKG